MLISLCYTASPSRPYVLTEIPLVTTFTFYNTYLTLRVRFPPPVLRIGIENEGEVSTEKLVHQISEEEESEDQKLK
jgi:hypothetical protein